MTLQQISTPSIVEIRDSVILTSGSYPSPHHLNIPYRDPWDDVLTSIDQFALETVNIIPALNASLSPSATNYYVTNSNLMSRLIGTKVFILVGLSGSSADYEGDDETPFNAAISDLLSRNPDGGWLVISQGTYTFTSTVNVPSGINILGVHPEKVLITGNGDFPVFNLSGNNVYLSQVTINSVGQTTQPALKATGQKNTISAVKIDNFDFIGVLVAGYRNYLYECKISSNNSNASGVWFQYGQHRIERSSFDGTLPQGALYIESSENGCFVCTFSETLTGYSYRILSAANWDNRLVSNHFGSEASLNLSSDYGTNTVRYGNTPNTYISNQNNFLVPLATFVGQESISDSEMNLSNSFTHDPLIDKDAASIWSALDLFIQRSYEERNWFLTSDDPTYDTDGTPLTGIFSWRCTWEGMTLTYPNFKIRPSIHRQGSWVVNAGSNLLGAGEALVVDIDQTLGEALVVDIDQTLNVSDITLTPTIMSLPLALQDPTDSQRFILAVGLTGSVALWLNGFRLLTELTSFDVDGHPLPLTRFVGVTDTRNPAAPFSGFSGASQSNITDKLSAQSEHLKLLFEKSNLEYQTSDMGEITTDPLAGDWYSASDMNNGIPASPTHLISLKGQTFGIVPPPISGYGLYKFVRNSISWVQVVCGIYGDDFVSVSKYKNGLLLLKTDGTLVFYDPENLSGTWTLITPTLSDVLLNSLSFTTSRGSSFEVGGQADYALQTPDNSFFTLLEGFTARYNSERNELAYSPKIYTEALGEDGLLSHKLKDTGYNTIREENTLWETGDNGGLSSTHDLPTAIKAKIITAITMSFNGGTPYINDMIMTLKNTDWSSSNIKMENFSHDPFSGMFLVVYKNTSTGSWYVFGGGKDIVYCIKEFTSSAVEFTNFTPMYWSLNAAAQEIIILGADTTLAFQVISGKYNGTLWVWASSVLDIANTCQGCVGVYDIYPNGGTGDFYALVSNPSMLNRPTIWKRSGGIWSYKNLTNSPSGPNDVLVTAADQNSFNYNFLTDSLKSQGVASPKGISFLVKDDAVNRVGRPTIFYYNRNTLAYVGYRLGETAAPLKDITLVGADANSILQIYGYGYNSYYQVDYWVARTSTNYVNYFFVFEQAHADLNTWQLFTYTAIAPTNCPFTKRSGGNTFGSSVPYNNSVLYSWFTQKEIRLRIIGNAAGFSSINFLSDWMDNGINPPGWIPCNSTNPISTYQCQLGISKGGDFNIHIGSYYENLPNQYAGFDNELTSYTQNTNGIMWFEQGRKLRHVGNNIWVGLNRGGYFYIVNPAKSNKQIELKPNITALRGTIRVFNLGTTDNYDWMWDSGGTQLALFYRDFGNFNNLAFIVYDTTTNTVTKHSRFGLPGHTYQTSSIPLQSTPRTTVDSYSGNYGVVAQEDTRGTGLYIFYWGTPFSAPADGTFTVEQVGGSALTSLEGKNPAKPVILPSGEVLVASEDGSRVGSNYNLKLARRTTGAIWYHYDRSNPAIFGGFKNPEFVKTGGNNLWVLGNFDGAYARIGKLTYPSYSFYWITPNYNLIQGCYNRSLEITAIGQSDHILMASPLATIDGIPNRQELGVFKYYDNGDVAKANYFAAKGRLQVNYSGEEETTYSDVSFVSSTELVYGAYRPGRANNHWSVRKTYNDWDFLGENVLGSGRYITIGDCHYREQYLDLLKDTYIPSLPYTVAEIKKINNVPTITNSQNYLPIAETEFNNFIASNWQYNSLTSDYLFYRGNSTGYTSDTSLQTVSTSMKSLKTRIWPIILGNTKLTGSPGAGTLYHGSLLMYLPPTTETNLSYFGNSLIGSNNYFRLIARPALTFNGVHKFKTNDSSLKEYTITGPVSFYLDTPAVNSHLTLTFNTASSLVMDSTSTLSNWVSLNYPQTTYALVLGELFPEEFIIYPTARKGSYEYSLTLGHLEPYEVDNIKTAKYRIPAHLVTKRNIKKVEVIKTGLDKVALKYLGSLEGVQYFDFPPGTSIKLLLKLALPPLSTGYYLYADDLDISDIQEGDLLTVIVGRNSNLISW